MRRDNSNNKLSSDRYHVGGFVVDLNSGTVTAPSGKKAELKAIAIKTLCVFMSSPNKFFTVNELMDEVYGQIETSQSVIHQNIKQLRAAFNDDKKSIIENKQTIGYRLTLVVEPYREAAELKPKHTSLNPNTPSAFLAVLATLLIAVIIWLTYPSKVIREFGEQTPLTHLKGQAYFPRISSDFRYLVFSHRHKSNDWALYIRDLQSDTLTPLLSDQGISYKHGKLSKDGQKIFFTKLSDGKCELMLAEFDSNSLKLGELILLQNCDLAAEGAQIIEGRTEDQYIYSNTVGINRPFALFHFNSINGGIEQITAPPKTGRGDYYMSISPDKKQLVFLRNTERYTTQIRLFDLEKRSDIFLTEVGATLFTVNWAKNGRSIIYKNRANQIVEFDINSKRSKLLKHPQFPVYAPFLLERSGDRVGVIGGSLMDRDISNYKLNDNLLVPLIDSSFSDSLPVFHNKSKRLVWISNRSGLYQIWSKLGDEAPKRLTDIQHSGRFTSLAISAKGDQIGGTLNGDWFVFDLTSKHLIWDQEDEFHFTNFSWQSTKAKAYVTGTNYDGSVLYSVDTNTGEAKPDPRWRGAHVVKQSPDGRWVFAWYRSNQQLIRFDSLNNEEFIISTQNQAAIANQWLVNNKAFIWLHQPASGPSYLNQISHHENHIVPIGNLSYYGYITHSPIKDSLIVTVRNRSNVNLVEI